MTRKGDGTLTQRPDGRWEARLQVAGRRCSVYGRTKAEAKAALEGLRRQAGTVGRLPEPHTLGDLLTLWLETGQRRWRPRTLANYTADAQVIRTALGENLSLSRLDPGRIQSFLTATPSARRSQQLHQVLHAAGTLAVKLGWLASNPADRVDRPQRPTSERTWWTVEQCRAFLDATRPSRWWPLWAVALATGLREGELLSLRWTDTDSAVLRVERAGTFVAKEWVEGPPKTASGRRTVPLNALAREALQRQHVQQATWKLAAGPAWTDRGLIFTTHEGTPLRRFEVARALRQAVARAGLPPMTLHGLRHLAGSLALAAGVPLPLVSRMLGHAHVGITASIYSHALSDVRPATEGIARVLGGR